MTSKIGIMGGSFDPIHLGHLIVAEYAKEKFQLENVIFIPTGTPPHKDKQKMSCNKHRYEMTRLSIEDNLDYKICDLETKNMKTSYTIDTLKLIKEDYPDSDIYFILGLDSFKNLESWKGYKDILSNYKIIIAERLDSQEKDVYEKYKFYKENYPANIFFLEGPIIEISSTEIRERVKNGYSVKYLVRDEVNEYIKNNNLYK